MKKVCVFLLSLSFAAQAAAVFVPNGDFEDWLAVSGTSGSGWASEILTSDLNGDGIMDMYDAILQNDEFWTNPSNFGSGWQSNGPAGTSGKYGLQHPRKSSQNNMSAPFNGDFIGFVNLDDADGFAQSIQSGILGYLAEGTYTLTVAVSARPSVSWNDVRYDISLVADPAAGTLGSSGGTVLGTPASVTLVPATAVVGSNNQDLVYVLNVDAASAFLGSPFAVRIDVFNTLMQNGVPDDGAGGTNYRFTQGNFDNVRLEFVPEPAAAALLGIGGLFVSRRRR